MAHLVTGLFPDSKAAGEAIADLKNQGFAEEISLVGKDVNKEGGEVTHDIKENTSDGVAGGAAVGGAMGAIAGLAGLLTGAATATIPGVGFLVAGPLAAAVTGAVGGAVAGGIVGALVDKGIPDEKAKLYEDRVNAGQVLVTVSADHDKEAAVQTVFVNHGAQEIEVAHKDI